VRLGSEGFFLRGDAQAHCMGPFRRSAILGRAAKSYHHGRIRAHDRGAWRNRRIDLDSLWPAWLKAAAANLPNPELCRESAAADAPDFSPSPLRSSLRNLE